MKGVMKSRDIEKKCVNDVTAGFHINVDNGIFHDLLYGQKIGYFLFGKQNQSYFFKNMPPVCCVFLPANGWFTFFSDNLHMLYFSGKVQHANIKIARYFVDICDICLYLSQDSRTKSCYH